MWIFTRHGFFSIVCATEPDTNRPKQDLLMVRGRRREDLEALMYQCNIKNTQIVENDGTDYRFRIFIDRPTLGKIMDILAADITYNNFKGSLDEDDSEYRRACSRVWGTMLELQEPNEWFDLPDYS